MDQINTICICGAGTMGSGIAQVCAQSGFKTILFDLQPPVLGKAKESIYQNLEILVGKQKITSGEKEQIYQRITFVNAADECVANVIIEAIVEKMDAKVSLFDQLAAVNGEHTIFATNTSSLSVSAIQKNRLYAQQVVGMHFFNPAYAMKLVEVVKGDQTSNAVVQAIYELCKQMGKLPVMCKDSPGFIVNRVARQYYLEAMTLVEKGIATVENIDEIMEATGFKMGPFKLMDLIGMDINLSVSQSIYDAFNNAERLKPSEIQVQKVKANKLGRKTGEGFYEYG